MTRPLWLSGMAVSAVAALVAKLAGHDGWAVIFGLALVCLIFAVDVFTDSLPRVRLDSDDAPTSPRVSDED